MTKERLFAIHQELSIKGLDILRAKNADYSLETPLGNFYLSEALQVCPAENGIINRIGDNYPASSLCVLKVLRYKTKN